MDPSFRDRTLSNSSKLFPYPVPKQQKWVEPSLLTQCFPIPSCPIPVLTPTTPATHLRDLTLPYPDLLWLQPCPVVSLPLHCFMQHPRGSLVMGLFEALFEVFNFIFFKVTFVDTCTLVLKKRIFQNVCLEICTSNKP